MLLPYQPDYKTQQALKVPGTGTTIGASCTGNTGTQGPQEGPGCLQVPASYILIYLRLSTWADLTLQTYPSWLYPPASNQTYKLHERPKIARYLTLCTIFVRDYFIERTTFDRSIELIFPRNARRPFSQWGKCENCHCYTKSIHKTYLTCFTIDPVSQLFSCLVDLIFPARPRLPDELVCRRIVSVFLCNQVIQLSFSLIRWSRFLSFGTYYKLHCTRLPLQASHRL